MLNDNYQQASRSLDLLPELGPVTMLPEHGKAWRGDMADAMIMARSYQT